MELKTTEFLHGHDGRGTGGLVFTTEVSLPPVLRASQHQPVDRDSQLTPLPMLGSESSMTSLPPIGPSFSSATVLSNNNNNNEMNIVEKKRASWMRRVAQHDEKRQLDRKANKSESMVRKDPQQQQQVPKSTSVMRIATIAGLERG